MNSFLLCCLFFVGLSTFQFTVGRSENLNESQEVPSDSGNQSHFFVERQLSFDYMLDVNDDIANFLFAECDKLLLPMEQITNLGKSIHFLALDDNETLQLQPLHSYLMYINGVCDDLRDQIKHFADDRYVRYTSGVLYNLTSDQILRFGSPSRLDWAVAVTEENLETIKSLFSKNETKNAIEVAELKKLKISTEIIELSASIKEIQLGVESLMAITKIKNDFLNNVQKIAEELEKHVHDVVKLDDLVETVTKCIEFVVNAQKGIPLELALSFIV